jgi:uncharacterized protein YndB with AHSA1/START domain
MKEELSFEAFYPDPPERVWHALTDPKALGKWLMPTTFKPLLGFRFRFEGLNRGMRSTVEGQVIELEEGRRLSYTWDDGDDNAPGVVSWTLKPKDGGTHLTLEHSVAEPVKPYVLIEASMNWRYALHGSLPVLLRLLGEEKQRPKAPIVYVSEEPEDQDKPKRRAGFRQEEATCQS